MTSLAARLDGLVRPIAPPERLAAIRVLVGAFGAVYCTVRAPSMASVAGLHATSFAPTGVTRVLSAPLPGPVVWALVLATVALSYTFVLGEDVQTALPESMFVFPVREGIELPPDWVAHAEQPTDPVVLVPAEVADNRDDWLEQWRELITQ